MEKLKKKTKQNNIPNIGLIVAPSVRESRGMVQRKVFQFRRSWGGENKEKAGESVTYISSSTLIYMHEEENE